MKFSVVVPVLNEAAVIRDTLQSLKRQAPDEIIVVDGNSRDNTRAIASQYADHVVSSAPGRAHQMNVGAGYTEADVIIFLHADTQLPDDALNTLRDLFLSSPDLTGGRFRISFNNTSFKYRLISFYTRFYPFSYGDQAFFVRKPVFDRLGGFNETVLFEDVDFFKRLRKAGPTRILKEAVVTSARRFEQTGFFKQKLINIFLTILVLLGLNPKPLARKIYPEIR